MTSNVYWDLDQPWFGGFSGAEISGDGKTITLITDKGLLLRARLVRDANGHISAMQVLSQVQLKHANGRPLNGKDSDAEGLAISRSGNIYVSFEHHHRVVRVSNAAGRTRPLPKTNAFAALDRNAGLEALAIHPDGSLYTLPERSAGNGQPFDLLRYKNGKWTTAHQIRRKGPFLPVGADFDASGKFYLLERAITPLGFRSRIRRFNLTNPEPVEELQLTTRAGQFDNLEALSLWTDSRGRTRLLMISDDNFLSIQRTQIVEYTLTE